MPRSFPATTSFTPHQTPAGLSWYPRPSLPALLEVPELSPQSLMPLRFNVQEFAQPV
jgi:hypothetical protein